MLELVHSKRPAHRRGLVAQRPHRTAERMVRRSVLVVTRWMGWRGHTREESAALIGVERTTLGVWSREWAEDRLAIEARGRTPEHADRELRQAVLALFALIGPHVGMPTLQSIFPGCPRNELQEMLDRFRSMGRRGRARLLHVLTWHWPGAVWTMDGTKPPCPVDGLYAKVLAVRDLASRESLAAVPARAEDGESCAAVLEALFIEHGPPLVLKSDNGPCRSDEVEDLLQRYNVLHLASPPHTPRYNGAIEAGIGALKTEAHWESARRGHIGQWTSDDIEAARRKHNELHRPWGVDQPTPDMAWSDRVPLDDEDRSDFLKAVWAYRNDEISRCGVLPGIPLSREETMAVQRIAISRALLALGYLTIRRRRIAPPFSRPYLRNIS